MSESVTQPALERSLAPSTERRVVMVASADTEPSLADVVTNLATVCAQIGQRVALVSTAGLSSPGADAELPPSTPLWWDHWPSPGGGAGLTVEEDSARLLRGPLKPSDAENLLEETGVPGVLRLDLRHFVGHPAQVVIRVPEVLAALRGVVDVVFLEVPSYLSVHHGEGLTPLADVVLVVAERETTTLEEMRRISAVLRRLDAPVVGMALTDGGLEFYDWEHGDAEFKPGHERPGDQRDPTEQIPISEPTPGVASAPPGLDDSEFKPGHERPGDQRDPTEQMPISEPTPGVACAPPGLDDSEFKPGHERPGDQRDPTEQMPMSEPSPGVASAPPFAELTVIEHAPREV